MRRGRPSRPLKILMRERPSELHRIAIDTGVGMIFSNAIAFFIILATATTLHAHGVTDIKTAADAANALRPIAGNFAFLMFALGIIGTGLLAVPVLAGSAAYGVAEAFGWKATLEAKFPEAIGFYTIISAATLIGFVMSFTPIDPMRLLVGSAVVNGIVAVPIMAVMMLIVTKPDVMGRYRAHPWLTYAGWGATVLMGLTVFALIGSALW